MRKVCVLTLWYAACFLGGWFSAEAFFGQPVVASEPRTYTEAEVIEIAEHAIKRQSVKIIEYCAESGMTYFDVDLDGKTDFVMACKVKKYESGINL